MGQFFMDFVHTPYTPGDTIAALATPPGQGGIAIVRVSGKKALSISQHLFSKDLSTIPSHTAVMGTVKSIEGEFIDQALVLVMRAPRTFTGEETVEFHCHGGPVIVRKILKLLFECGARPARPGEFSFQAFMNGKLDLTQAEAIQNIISAKGEGAYQAAKEHLAGRLQELIQSYKKRLTHLGAILEAWVDFPEEGLEFSTHEEMSRDLTSLLQKMEILLSTFEEGKRLREGLKVVILGPPNAGKSSLLNALLRKQRAIVTEIAGTTRDSIEEQMLLEGLCLSLVDTAGIRETDERVEKEGIKRAWSYAESADVVLLVIDATLPDGLAQFRHLPEKKVLLVWNKIDLLSPKEAKLLPKFGNGCVAISAKNEEGLEALKKELSHYALNTELPDVVLTSLRHKEALERAISAVKIVLEGLSRNESPEFLTHEVREGIKALGEIIGADVTEEILSSIFSTFCVGK
jgi:tRNA modification GTPase